MPRRDDPRAADQGGAATGPDKGDSTAVILALFLFVLLLAVTSFAMSRRRAFAVARGSPARLHSRPSYHGFYSLLWVLGAGWGMLLLMSLAGNLWIDSSLMADIAAARPDSLLIERQLILSDTKALAAGKLASQSDELRLALADDYAGMTATRTYLTLALVVAAGLAAASVTRSRIAPDWRARNKSEAIIRYILLAMAVVAILTTIGIVLSLIFETINFFSNIGWRIDRFLFGTAWSPLSGVQEGQLDPTKVGAVPLFLGTFLITLIAMLVAAPIGLFAAIYLSDFASKRARAVIKPVLEILAGIPTVVYGFFAAITVAPFFRGIGENIGISIASESALAAGVVMGIMIIPFISSLSDDVINAVPQALRDGSYGLGATKAETMRQVVLPAALPGIVSAILLGVSRAVGETMIVVMAAGQGANLTANPFEAVTTVTVQIVMLITGDTEASTAAGPAFALGFTLFLLTLMMNVAAQRIVARYREIYD